MLIDFSAFHAALLNDTSRQVAYRVAEQRRYFASELSTDRMDLRVGSGRVGSGRVTILPDFGGSGRVGSALRIF